MKKSCNITVPTTKYLSLIHILYRRSTSKKRAAEAEREARLEEKEATSAEDVEEILLEIEDRQPEPCGGGSATGR